MNTYSREVNGTNYIGFVCNGTYAEKFVGKAGNAYLLPDTVSDVAAGLIEPLMVAYHAVRKACINLGRQFVLNFKENLSDLSVFFKYRHKGGGKNYFELKTFLNFREYKLR